MQYALKLVETEAGTGYFSCRPAEDMGFDAALSCLRQSPNDEFIRRWLLRLISGWDKDRMQQAIDRARKNDALLNALLHETCLLSDRFKGLRKAFEKPELRSLQAHTPLIYIRSQLLGDQALHRKWIRLFGQNITGHRPLPPPDKAGLPLLFSESRPPEAQAGEVTLPTVYDDLIQTPLPPSPPRPVPEETARIALEKLERVGVISGEEMRHVSSLSPVALLREWQVKISVQNGRHHYRFQGTQTAYGRGLDLEPARAACLMEMAERYSAFASFSPEGVLGYEHEYPLTRARYSDLADGEIRTLNPDHLALEAPYDDTPLHWIRGEARTGSGSEPIRIPAQCVFLFCNLDEAKLFSGLGSTGLAAGNTMEEAKVSALLEIIERHDEGVTPFSPAQCFDLESHDPEIARLLSAYRDRGIRIQFQDITGPMGVPCCKCFVITPQGKIVKGTGAHLNARQALVSAMTETPCPFPHGGPSGPGLERLLRVPLEDLPDYSTGGAAGDLHLLETLLRANGHTPVYADLTRQDIGLPVVRAIVPGMEITADFDRFSRVHPQLFTRYLKIFK
ncbi:YcaO-type kinase domain-containing protein [Desulfonema ishimotonii]|uniref:YcaO-type kinase domain-containing protein n=2 Tax=Desulfonema ishimotonii TaxID=45657 RepID=A0A401FYH3_9BACT|nr:YcaO-type kinase domain-containing protein [Desulfonema ishimotonii]